jgi:uncharacterized integral membrane protein (TIGR00697 family)
MTFLFQAIPSNLDSSLIAKRREVVFIALAGLFLTTLGLLNVLGLTRILDFSFSIGSWHIPVILPLGILPYPITFLCNDLICEFYGKQRATLVVWVGLWVNIWIFCILWACAFLPPHVPIDPYTHLPEVTNPNFSFYQIRLYAMSNVIGSMIAYLVAQLLDVQIFQFCKRITKGKHLWLRSNASTLVSQFVDTIIVLSFGYFFTNALSHLPGDSDFNILLTLILSGYIFKLLVTLLSTFPFYFAVYSLRKYLNLSTDNFTDNQPLTPIVSPS